MNTGNAKGRYFENNEEWWANGKVGDWSFYYKDDQVAGIFIRTPNGTPEGHITGPAFIRLGNSEHAIWQWNGSKEAPTLTPSIGVRDMNDYHSGRFEWHGWMRNGELVSA